MLMRLTFVRMFGPSSLNQAQSEGFSIFRGQLFKSRGRSDLHEALKLAYLADLGSKTTVSRFLFLFNLRPDRTKRPVQMRFKEVDEGLKSRERRKKKNTEAGQAAVWSYLHAAMSLGKRQHGNMDRGWERKG